MLALEQLCCIKADAVPVGDRIEQLEARVADLVKALADSRRQAELVLLAHARMRAWIVCLCAQHCSRLAYAFLSCVTRCSSSSRRTRVSIFARAHQRTSWRGRVCAASLQVEVALKDELAKTAQQARAVVPVAAEITELRAAVEKSSNT